MKDILEQSADELRENALHALSAVEKLTTRLAQISNEDKDRRSAEGVIRAARAATEILTDWYRVDE